MVAFPEYTYIAVLGIIFGFGMAFGIGANDVANAFGSSVSAGSLTLGQAIVLGSIMEFAGAVSLGASVTGTIRKGILNSEFYTDQPEVFMLGDLCALMVAAVFLMVATHYQYAVSTTHCIIACLIGFSLTAEGFESVDWFETGMVFVSWFVAPLFAALIGSIFFKTLLEVVLKSEHVFERALAVYPLVIFVGIGANLFFILFKINNNYEVENYGYVVVLPCSLGGGFLSALITWLFVVPRLRTRVSREHEERTDEANKDEAEAPAPVDQEDSDDGPLKDEADDSKKEVAPAEPAPAKNYRGISGSLNWIADNTFRQDLKTMSLAESQRATTIWEKTAVYDKKTEWLFTYLQVFTACLAAFAHGTNDVANAIAPLSGILEIWKNGELESKSDVPKWILAMGGAGLALGFMIYGYKIIMAVGYKLTAITPSRGFCIELAAALAVSLSSFMEMPVSTTQCLVGATMGVGFASGGPSNVEWWFFLRTLFGWVGLFFISLFTTAGFFAFTAFSPSV